MKEDKTTHSNESNCFNTALLINIEKSNSPRSLSPPSLSPRSPNQAESTSSLHNYLPFDLIKCIDTISPVHRDFSSNSHQMSDLEMKEDKSESSENEEIFLNQYDEIKCADDYTSTANSISTYHKSSTGSNNSISSSSYIEQMKNSMMNGFTNNRVLPVWLPQSNGMNYVQQNTVNNKKKKSKRMKKKEKDEYTIEMFGRRGWICEQCNNFNYDSRHKCNRCGIQKKAKIVNGLNINQNVDNEQTNIHKGDWCCQNCSNLNYAFRLVCNRCQMPKGDGSNVAYSSS